MFSLANMALKNVKSFELFFSPRPARFLAGYGKASGGACRAGVATQPVAKDPVAVGIIFARSCT
jgi:hypothetical protein